MKIISLNWRRQLHLLHNLRLGVDAVGFFAGLAAELLLVQEFQSVEAYQLIVLVNILHPVRLVVVQIRLGQRGVDGGGELAQIPHRLHGDGIAVVFAGAFLGDFHTLEFIPVLGKISDFLLRQIRLNAPRAEGIAHAFVSGAAVQLKARIHTEQNLFRTWLLGLFVFVGQHGKSFGQPLGQVNGDFRLLVQPELVKQRLGRHGICNGVSFCIIDISPDGSNRNILVLPNFLQGGKLLPLNKLECSQLSQQGGEQQESGKKEHVNAYGELVAPFAVFHIFICLPSGERGFHASTSFKVRVHYTV
ncbi:hypothetical protein D3C75_692530 [compost metagenome]